MILNIFSNSILIKKNTKTLKLRKMNKKDFICVNLFFILCNIFCKHDIILWVGSTLMPIK